MSTVNYYSPEEPVFVGECNNRPTYSKVLGLICIIIATSAFITSIYLHAFTGRNVPFDYGIVIDAGSSHTQAFLYQWLGSKESGTGRVVQQDTCTYEHGIDSVADPTIIVNCVNNVIESIPSILRTQTPLYLGATAGMRLLNITDPEETNLRLVAVRCALKQTLLQVKDVGIISGSNEGLYAWTTVNFLEDTLNPKQGVQPWNITYGALDLGGASTQFSYAVNPNHRSLDDVTPLKLYGIKYNVISQSFLCFGAEQAFLRHQALLIENVNSTEIITDPCLPEGNFSVSEALTLLNSPCTTTLQFRKWLKIFDLENKTFTFKGSSDFEKCKENIATLLNITACQEKGFEECSQSINISSSGRKFMAFSSFSYVTSFLNATNVTLNEFIDITSKWCSLTWEKINEHHYSPSVFSHITRYCFGGTYIIYWLTKIYGFDATSWNKLIFQDKIGKSDIGWSLGYMINATNAVPEEKMTEPTISLGVFIVLVIWSVILLIFGLSFLIKFSRLRQRFGYSRFQD